MSQVRVAEFFAGIGLARVAMEQAAATVLWSNDIDPVKARLYRNHFGSDADHVFDERDIAEVAGGDVPAVDIAWASFPCTDLSLAGERRGLHGAHSSTFFHALRILGAQRERPAVVALENVVGLATSHGGEDLRVAVSALNDLGYLVDVLTLDARRFVAQSRPRLFLVGSASPVRAATGDDRTLRPDWLQFVVDDPRLVTHRADLPEPPPMLTGGFSACADQLDDRDLAWWDSKRTEAFIASLSDRQRDRLERLRASDTVEHRTMYRRTRAGAPVWEIREDDIAGCLRTARGGSSKQAVVRAGRGTVRARWMTAHEYAVLMGAPEYTLTGVRPLQAIFGFGDAVCVPAVRWLAEHYLLPLCAGALDARTAAVAHA